MQSARIEDRRLGEAPDTRRRLDFDAVVTGIVFCIQIGPRSTASSLGLMHFGSDGRHRIAIA